MTTRLVVGIMTAAAILLAYLLGGGAGTSISYQNGLGTFEVSSSVLSLLGSLLLLVTYSITLEPAKDGSSIGARAGAARRAAAWLIDFWVALTTLTSVLALIPLSVEAISTGHFVWEFQRSSVSTVDWFVTLVVIGLAFLGMGFYWTRPVMTRSQTVGQCILAIRVVPATSAALSPKRIWLRSILQPFAPFLWLARIVSGKYWQDELTNTKVVKIRTHHAAA